MANPKNTAALQELKARFEEADATVLTEYRGLAVEPGASGNVAAGTIRSNVSRRWFLENLTLSLILLHFEKK